jgi:hypothetical protein
MHIEHQIWSDGKTPLLKKFRPTEPAQAGFGTSHGWFLLSISVQTGFCCPFRI